MKQDELPWNSKKTKKTKQTQELKASTASICNMVIHHHALYFWKLFICWPQSLQTLRICLQRSYGSRWFIYSAATFVSGCPSALSGLFTLFMDVACVCVYVEPNKDCFRACPFTSKCALSVQHTLGASPQWKSHRPSNDKFQLPVIISTNPFFTQVSLEAIPRGCPSRCMRNLGRSCQNTLTGSYRVLCIYKSCIWVIFWKIWKKSAWQYGSDMFRICIRGVLLALTSPFVKTDYYLLNTRSYCGNYSYTIVI